MGIFGKIFGNKSKNSSDVKSKVEVQVAAKDDKSMEVEKKIKAQFDEFNNKYIDIKNKGNRLITINGQHKSVVSFNERMFNDDTICVFVRRRYSANVISEYEDVVDFLYKRPNKSYEYYSIKVCDINHYEIIGEYHRDINITGGSVSGGNYDIKKSAIGYAIAGPVGAVIAGKNEITSDTIKTSYDVTDTRETVLYYVIGARDKKIIMPKEAYDSLKAIIPEKDIKNSVFKTRAMINEEIRKIGDEVEKRKRALMAKDKAINSSFEPIIQGILGELKNSKNGLTIQEIKNIVNEKYRSDIQSIADCGGNIDNITERVLLRARAKGAVEISEESVKNYEAIVTFVDEGERELAKIERKKRLNSELSVKHKEDVKLLRGKYKEISDTECVVSDREIRETILEADLTSLVEILYGDVIIRDNHKINIEIIQNLLYVKAAIRNLFDYRPLEYSDEQISIGMRKLVNENMVERFVVKHVAMFKIKNDFVKDLYNKINES